MLVVSTSIGSISDTCVTLGRFRNLMLIVGLFPPRIDSNNFFREKGFVGCFAVVRGDEVVVLRL